MKLLALTPAPWPPMYCSSEMSRIRKTNGDGPGWLSMALTVGVDRLRGRPRGFEAASMLSAGLVL